MEGEEKEESLKNPRPYVYEVEEHSMCMMRVEEKSQKKWRTSIYVANRCCWGKQLTLILRELGNSLFVVPWA
jgi:hypothetical protein